MVEGGQRALRRPIGRFPSARGDRCSRVIAVSAEVGIDATKGEGTAAADREGITDGVAGAPGRQPLAVGAFEKGEIMGIVNRKERRHAEIAYALPIAELFDDRER